MYGKKFATVCVIGLTGWIVANSGEVPNANGVTANGPVVAAIEAPTLAVPVSAIESSFVVQRQDELAWSRGRIVELEATVKDLEAQIMRLTTPQQKPAQAPAKQAPVDAYQKPQQFRSFSSCSGPGCGQSSGGAFGGGGLFNGRFRRR